LRYGDFGDQQPGEGMSDELGHVIFFAPTHEATLALLKEYWRRHEKLIRKDLNDGEEPYILERMASVKKTIDLNRKWIAENKD